ncbi:ectopic P granules protein 5 homolog [Clytia hemisphaerica]
MAEESRLHDPNLYLDSLQMRTCPIYWMKIFQGNQDIWYEYVSAEVLNSDLTFLASLWQPAQHSISTASLEAFSSNQQSSCEERVVKRLSNEGAPRPSPNVRRPESPVKDVTLRVILTQPKLFQEINHDLNRIVEYAKRSSSLQASHVGLDNEYLEMLPDLYETVTVRLTVHIPCDGSKHKTGCKAPAVVTVKFDELRLRERVQRLLEDNRSAFDQLVQNAREAFPFDLCVSTVNIENIIEKLSQVFQTIDAQRRNDLQQSARKLFYLLAELINDDVKRCYPAIQFFSSGVEVLGKAYIADKGSEQMPLLETTLTHTSSVMFLAPHFSPMCTSNEEFVELYSKVISYIPQNIDTVIFVLLSKFEILNWLNHQTPTKPIISSLLTHTMKAIGLIGREPDSEGFVILEVLRNHLNTLLRSDLDTNYWVVFTELLTLSSQANVSTLCWSDFLSAFDFEEEINSNSTCRISIDRVKESLYYMGCYFQNVCESLNHELEALYKIWEPYTKPLVILLKNLFYHSIIHSFRHRAGRTKETVLRELWENIVSVFKPWIIPQSSGKVWTLLRVESIILLVQTFTDTIRLVVDCSSEDNEIYCFILNDLLSFYGAEIARFVIEEQSIEIFHTSLSMLPWQNYCPTVQEMTYTIQIYNTDRNTFKFYASVLLDVDWENVGVTYLNSGNNSLVSQFHQLLLHNILMFTTSSYLANKCKVKLCTMLVAIKNFRWNTLILEDTARVCQWYSQNMDSALILEKESIVWRTLDFLKQVCGFFYLEGLVTDDIVITKRNIYIQVMTTLITRCSSQKKQVSEFQWVMKQLLSDIESTVGYNSTNPMYELITHCSNCLSLQNHIAQGPIAIAIKSSIDSHLLSTSCAMMVLACISSASRCLANLADMVSLLEQAISCHFVRLNDAELRNAWTPIMQAFVIPELSKEDFVAEAIKQNALLTLYSYNLHRMNNLRTQAEHLDIMVDCVTWCSKPQLDKDSEAKLLLLWLQTFDIVRTQAAQKQLSNEHWKSIAKYMMFLVASTHVQGEDKYYSGVLGMVGIGRRSDLSKEFRLAAKALHLFLTCQLPSSLIPIRNGPDSPGAIRNAQNKNSRPTSEAEKAYTAFQGLVKNKTYQPMRREIEWVIQFVSKPETNINDGCTLLAYLAQQFFFKNNFIGAIIV